MGIEPTDPALVAPLIVGLVEVAKRAGLPARYAPLLALGLGIAAGLATAAGFERAAVVAAVWRGAAAGLAAVGLYEIGGQVSRWRSERHGDAG